MRPHSRVKRLRSGEWDLPAAPEPSAAAQIAEQVADFLDPSFDLAELEAMLEEVVEADEDLDRDVWEGIALQADYNAEAERVLRGRQVEVR